MSDIASPGLFDRAIRRINTIWRDMAAGVEDVSIAAQMRACLNGRGGEVSARNRAAKLAETFEKAASFRRRERTQRIRGPLDLVEAVFDAGRRGLTIQRYKGLGEMNPEQLWETTLDSNARTLLQVKVNHADDADDMFTRLMGDLVEPRREFIQDNALDAEVDV